MLKEVLSLFVCAVIGSQAIAATLVLQQGLNNYTGTQDTTIYDTDVNNSAGGFPYLYVGQSQNRGSRRSLIRFDLSAIAAGSTVTSATLQFYIDPISRPTSITGSVHRLTRTWTEGNNLIPDQNAGGAGAPAQPGDTTWNHVSFNTMLWNTAGGEFAAQPAATGVLGNADTFAFFSGQGLAADVQTWVETPSLNYGWIVRGDEAEIWTAKRLFSSESTDPRKPILYIEFTPPSLVPDWVLY